MSTDLVFLSCLQCTKQLSYDEYVGWIDLLWSCDCYNLTVWSSTSWSCLRKLTIECLGGRTSLEKFKPSLNKSWHHLFFKRISVYETGFTHTERVAFFTNTQHASYRRACTSNTAHVTGVNMVWTFSLSQKFQWHACTQRREQ